MGYNLRLRKMPTLITLLNIFVVEFESINKKWLADQTYQKLINK